MTKKPTSQDQEKTGSELAKLSVVLKNTKNRSLLASALTRGLDMDRFIKCAWIQINLSDDIRDLAKRKPANVFRAMLQCASMGLYPDGISGDAYLVKFGDNCVVIRGYNGLMRLFNDHPDSASIPFVADVVREKDAWGYELGAKPTLFHRPSLEPDRGDVTHYYAIARFKDGTILPKVMTAIEVEEFKKYAKTETFWDSEHENTRLWMRKKTVIRQLAKMLPASPEIVQAMDADERAERGKLVEETLDGDHVYGAEVAPAQAVPVEPKPEPAPVAATPVTEEADPLESEAFFDE